MADRFSERMFLVAAILWFGIGFVRYFMGIETHGEAVAYTAIGTAYWALSRTYVVDRKLGNGKDGK